MDSLIRLGATILGVIVKVVSKNETIGNVVDGAFLIADVANEDFFAKRNADRTSAEISDSISKSCYQILQHHKIIGDRADVICNIVIDVVAESNLTYEVVIANKASADAIYNHLLVVASECKKQFDPNEYDVFLRLLHHVSGIIVNTSLESPRFVNHGINYVASVILEIQKQTEDVLKRLEEIDLAVSRKTQDFQVFERRYRSNVAEKYGSIELLGAKSLDREARKYQLSIAYVSLELRKGGNPSGSVAIEKLFNNSRLLWIDGDAGSGKSTLLQWIAVNSALNNGEILPELKDSIPFLIELRKQNARSIEIKKAIDFAMPDCDCTMPDNWMTQSLESGNAIVLIDGYDEVKEDDRDAVLSWIEDISRKYPKIRMVVTSRPQVKKQNLKHFKIYRLLPMTRDKVEQFLKYWHEAVLVDRIGIDPDEAHQYMKKLSSQIDNSMSIRRMVTNPLLCAMICALHYKNGAVMSRERNGLYDDCCRMLLDNRDNEKEIQAFSNIKLSYEEKRIVLAQLAYWMMKNNFVVAEQEQVISRIRYSIQGLRRESQQYTPEELFQFFLERSGILRSPEANYVDFIHKSFQEYLAAFEIHNQDDWGFIAGRAGEIGWYETLILSMGFTSIHDSRLVIECILKNGVEERNIVIAAACGANAPQLAPDLRERINKKIEGVIPPKSSEASERLSSAGEFVVPYLENNKKLSADERYYSLNTLRMIATTQALVVAGTYLTKDAEPREIFLIGDMLENSYTKQEINDSNIADPICRYLQAMSSEKSLYIPESFFRATNLAALLSVRQDIANIKKLTIIGFQNRLLPRAMSLFSGVSEMSLIGDFDSISSISAVSHQLQSLLVHDLGNRFDFYNLKNYHFESLCKLYFYSHKRLYFNGCDCDSITGVEELGLYLFDSNSELLFDEFDRFSNLKSLDIYHEDVAELRFADLADKVAIEEITLKFPRYYTDTVMNYVKNQITSYGIPKVHIEHFDEIDTE